jgi:hypothetical protein
MLARSTIETWVIKAEKGDPNACPKCDGKVFEAEKMVTAAVTNTSIGVKFHPPPLFYETKQGKAQRLYF